jgi:predicted  nucleic acid-binding Zn-ribbon protein
MGWDVKATTDAMAQAIPTLPTLPSDLSLPQAAHWVLMAFLVLGVAAALIRLVPKVWAIVEETFLSNWRLALLGSAALLLSLAGGWTTWDGMKNFTGEPILSAMFTFGIHGVMLIVAWLIGESFATGMNQMSGPNRRRVSPPIIALSVLGGGLVLAALVATLITVGISNDQLLYGLGGGGAVVLATVLVLMFSKSDVVQPYAQGLRIVAKNSMLWVMFLACMATSVFFSFDSRFNVIFPKDQRERAAEIRTKNQVAGVVADIGETISSRRLTEAEHLFQSDGWKAYDTQLAALSKASEGAESEIEAHFTRQMEAHRQSIAQQQERMATATSGQAGLASKKATLTDELSRLKADRPGLAAELAGKKSELDNRAKEVDAKRVEAMAEDKGVEGTLKEGKGPVYRQIMGDMSRLKEYYKIGEERVRDAQKRLDAVDQRIAQIERELAGVDGELAKLKGEAVTADQRIKAAESSQLGQEGPKVDPARVRGAFEKARAEFRQQPGAETLGALHGYCVQLYDAMISTDATKDRVRNIDCDPKQAVEAAAVMFGLNSGLKAYETTCAGGDKVPTTGAVDGLLQFGRRCLQDSGLPSKESSAMAEKLSFIDLNRDDKAHNFVVSLNAFQDGNRLAYLALAIAIGIDSLIFMTGLFGANAVRSPLSDVPSMKARNSQQLNAMIETSLLPDVFKKARLVSQSMHPIENIDGYSNEVRLDELDQETAAQVRDVLNAGSIIGAVRRHDAPGRYLVRSELLEFLNTVIKRELEKNPEKAQLGMTLDQLEDQLVVALLPDVGRSCEAVLSELVPMDEDRGFTAQVSLDEIDDDVRPVMLNVLNTGTTFSRVQRIRGTSGYYIHKDLYKTLARIRAREFARGSAIPMLAGPQRRPVGHGGSLTPQRVALEDHTVKAPIADNGEIARTDYVAALVEALGMPSEAFIGIPAPAFTAAAAASEAFVHARQSNRLLDEELTERDEQARVALERAFAHLDASFAPADDWKRQQLVTAYQEVDQNWSVLMLMPDGPYETVLKSLVEQLEADNGAGALPAEEAALYSVAKRVVDALGQSNRNTDTAWIKLEAFFIQLSRAHPQVAQGDGKRTLN